ncbi:uncharacterized protein LOC114316355 [Camellia sinensis]|uniref:uncharacterized protein LOC114316355 n=1 Tax=Camellia sinensis TaxID=4442 RepID=UPI001036E470|nr:uncharacterized protein LOC114316355 [Camellia sinensis]
MAIKASLLCLIGVNGDWSITTLLARTCYYGQTPPVRTAWTNANIERRFIRYANYGIHVTCEYFEWIDPPLCCRSCDLLPRLVQRVNHMEFEVEKTQKKEKLYRRMLLGSWILFVCYIACTLK